MNNMMKKADEAFWAHERKRREDTRISQKEVEGYEPGTKAGYFSNVASGIHAKSSISKAHQELIGTSKGHEKAAEEHAKAAEHFSKSSIDPKVRDVLVGHHTEQATREKKNAERAGLSENAHFLSSHAASYKPTINKMAGEAHLVAAKAQESAGNTGVAKMHKEKAAEHAAIAGNEWDEESHPRDENGKFA